MDQISVLIASDSFKGSVSSIGVADLVELGVRRVAPDARVTKLAIADGGEGTVDAVLGALGGSLREVEVSGPLGDPVTARYGLVPDESGPVGGAPGGSGPVGGAPDGNAPDGGAPDGTAPGTFAVMETASSSGIALISQTSENARNASSIGVGQMILDALDHGARRIYVGLGGSATSDGGTGMADALGVRFLDACGLPVPRGLAGLESLARIDRSRLDARLASAEIVALTDVTNPLTGPTGAVRVYGPQKGLAADELERLDGWMQRYAEILGKTVGRDVASLPGAGAAGGLGAALVAFCGARVARGIEAVLDVIDIDGALEGVDLVITGEGRMDVQSAFGKAPVGVARRAKRHGIPVVAIVGSRAEDLGDVYDKGIDLVIPIATGPLTLRESMERADVLIPLAGETAARAFMLGRRT